MTNTPKPASPPVRWALAHDAQAAKFDAYGQTAVLKYCRSGGGPQLQSGDRMFGGLLQHLAVQFRDLPELQELRRIRAELHALPPDAYRDGGGGFMMRHSPNLGIPETVTVDFHQRDELVARLKEASVKAVAAVSRALQTTSRRSLAEIGAAILEKITPELEELARWQMQADLRGFGTDNKLVAQQLVDAMAQ